MENLNPWLLLIAGLLVGALVGGLAILFMERRNRGSDEDIRAARRELDDYRQEVADHYVETAKRVNSLTHSYKAVYDHLEDGAHRLVGEGELRRRLDAPGAEPVMLEGIGQRSLGRPADAYEEVEEPRDRPLDGAAAARTTADGSATAADPATAGAEDEPPPAPEPPRTPLEGDTHDVPPAPPPTRVGAPAERTAADVDAAEEAHVTPDEDVVSRSDADAEEEARRG